MQTKPNWISLNDFLSVHAIEANINAISISGIMANITKSIVEIYHIMQLSGLNDIIGYTGENNSCGDKVRKLDKIADEIICDEFATNSLIAAVAGEERKEVVPFADNYDTAEFVVMYDPLDGSMNSDFNITTGSIFSILPFLKLEPNIENSFKQSGDSQVAAIYAIYGVALKLVFSCGCGVYEFTYHQENNEFYLSKSRITIPNLGFQYACNEANSCQWHEKYRLYLDYIKRPETNPKYISRYLATVVGDVHRILHNGGIYFYPATLANKSGKIRLGYEANPLAFIIEQAGGKAYTDKGRILAQQMDSIHAQVPFFVGSIENMNDFLKITLQI